MVNNSSTDGSITIMGKEINVTHCLVSQVGLCFYPENPRIYSIVHRDGDSLSQEEIEERLGSQDHVKQLVQSIQANGGLIDPVIVREEDNVVLEGNSRLAAYRILAKKDPVLWGKIKCTILPRGITEDQVFALLGEYHIIGRKDWAPFEQAGYLWRRFKKHGIQPSRMAKEMGLSLKKINSLINVYDFMVNHDEEDVQRWSYYDEYLKSRPIKKARDLHLEMDDVIVNKIKIGEISRAVEVRDKVAKIAAAGGKTLSKFVAEDNSLESCYESALARGVNNTLLKRLHTFKEIIKDPDTKKELKAMPKPQLQKCIYELKKIQQGAEKILSVLA